jgi:hypothetical protein
MTRGRFELVLLSIALLHSMYNSPHTDGKARKNILAYLLIKF